MFVALFYVTKLTQLGDTERYISGKTIGSSYWWADSTHMMDLVAGGIARFAGSISANIFFCSLSLLGIYYSTSRLCLGKFQHAFLLIMLSTPSFGIWSSVASKEAVSVFYLGVLFGQLVDYLKKRKSPNPFILFFMLYLCIVFKPQYLVALLSMAIFCILVVEMNLRVANQVVLILAFIIFSAVSLYIFRIEIDNLSMQIYSHFDVPNSSTRQNDIWEARFDVFWAAPSGMLIAFVGPTLTEALGNRMLLLSWIESIFILAVVFFIFLRILICGVLSGKIRFFYVGLVITALPWLLFAHYPFGIFNPGSAIRYRANFFAFLMCLVFFLNSRVFRLSSPLLGFGNVLAGRRA